jgi:hypothetical protein
MPPMGQETFGKFFEILDLLKYEENGTQVIEINASGPKKADEDIKEICVWVFQRRGLNDAAATEMTTVPEGKEAFKPEKDRWTLPIGKIQSKYGFEAGPAIALAVALIDMPVKDPKSGKEQIAQKVLLWSQSIDLREAPKKTVTDRVKERAQAASKAREEVLKEAKKIERAEAAAKKTEVATASTTRQSADKAPKSRARPARSRRPAR